MEKETRTFNSIRNITFAAINLIINLIIGLVLRTLFIRFLGNEYLGINSLFTSVLNIISMAEMGFTTVAVVSLYQPISEDNLSKLAQYVNYYKKTYIAIAVVTFGLGILLIPFLPYFVKTTQNIEGLYVYYILFVLNSAVSYLCNYKLLVIQASQKEYLISKQKIYVDIVTTFLQIIEMAVFHNYVMYLLLMIGGNFVGNFLGSRKLKDVYPTLNLKEKQGLEKIEKQNVWKNIYSNFTYKLGSLLLSNSGDIFISAFAGTGVLGIYSNYVLFLNLVKSVMKSIYEQIYNSIGNLNYGEDAEHRERIFEVCIMVYAFLLTIALVGIYTCADSVIEVWLGNKYLMDRSILAVACLNYYFYMMAYPVTTFRVTSNYIKNSRYLSLIAASISITLGIMFGERLGIVGVLGALLIARMTTIFWYEPYILYKNVFKGSFFKYLMKQLKYLVTIITLGILENWIFMHIEGTGILYTSIKICLSATISIAIFCIINRTTPEFEYLYRKVKRERIK